MKSPRIVFRVLAAILFIVRLSAAQDSVSEARRLAFAGERDRAIELLKARLQESPGDTDARTLYGTILSWKGQYGEARTELEKVLAENHGHGDAMEALANVELWSDHPVRAEDLASQVLRDRPNDTDVLYTHARALLALHRTGEAREALDRILMLDPGNRDAQRARKELSDAELSWDAGVQHIHEWFSDGIGNRDETQISLKGQTPAGAVIGRFSNANRFNRFDNQVEFDFYPGLRKGTYAYLNAGVSPGAIIYPRYRLGADLYQTLGHGWEGTAGYRRLGFGVKVNLFTVALTKYQGDWMLTARGYFNPDSPGTTASVRLSVRRYLKDVRSYVEASWGHGGTPDRIVSVLDVQVLNSDGGALAFYHTAGRHWVLNGSMEVSHESRPGRLPIFHYTAGAGADFRF